MSINHILLKQQISECFCSFAKYFELVIKVANISAQSFDKTREFDFEHIKKLEHNCNDEYTKLSGDISWFISQLQPVANNLRFFLAIHLSLKDLERFADYSYQIAKIVRDNSEVVHRSAFSLDLFKKMLEILAKMKFIFLERPGRINREQYFKCYQLKKSFSSFYAEILDKTDQTDTQYLNTLMGHTDISSIKKIISLNDSIIVKIDRSLDHIFNVVENFFYIENPNTENLLLAEEDGNAHKS